MKASSVHAEHAGISWPSCGPRQLDYLPGQRDYVTRLHCEYRMPVVTRAHARLIASAADDCQRPCSRRRKARLSVLLSPSDMPPRVSIPTRTVAPITCTSLKWHQTSATKCRFLKWQLNDGLEHFLPRGSNSGACEGGGLATSNSSCGRLLWSSCWMKKSGGRRRGRRCSPLITGPPSLVKSSSFQTTGSRTGRRRVMVAHDYGDDDGADAGVIYGPARARSCIPTATSTGTAGIFSSPARYVSLAPPAASSAASATAGGVAGVAGEVAGVVAGEGATSQTSMVGHLGGEDEEETSQSVSGGSMRELQIEASRKIRDLARRSNLSEALKVMAKLQKEGVQPDTIAVSSLIAVCVKTGNMSRAQSIFDTAFSRKRGGKKDGEEEQGEEEKVVEEEEEGVLRPDAVVFGMLVRGYGASKTPQWGKISQLLASMERDYALKPSTSVFNELLQICARQNDSERGIELIDKMRKADLMPDYLTWEAVKKRKLLRSHFRKVFGGLL